jgi:hypothetical protein
MARSSDASETDSKSLPKMNPKIVRSLIHQKLDEIRAGELESSHNIPESCVRKLHQDKDMYKIFEGIIAKTWMDIDIMTSNESGLNGGQLNKRRKMYMDTLRREHDFCKAQIEEYNCILHPDGKQYAGNGDSDGISSTKSHSKDYDNMEDDEEEDGIDDEDEDNDTISSLSDAKISKSTASLQDDDTKNKKKRDKKKKKHKKDKKKRKKKKHKKRSKRRKSADNDSDSSTESKQKKQYEKLVQKAKLLFEEEKANILDQIPKEIINDFRTCGFAKWNKEYLPCMQLGPYDVAPGLIRDQWMDMFENAIQNDKQMTRLVFWYGISKDDLSNGFSFIQDSKIIPYEDGCEKGCDKVPTKIQKKIDQGKRLTATEQYKINGLEQIKRDSLLQKENRTPWLFEFEEDYDEYIDQLEDLSSEEEEEESTKKQKKEKTGKRKLDGGNHSKSKKQKTRSIDDEIDAEVKGEIEMEFDDELSEDDKNDDDFSMSDSDSDEDFQGDNEKASGKQKSGSDKGDKDVSAKEPKKRGRPKKAKTEYDIAQENFESCEKLFLPLMKKLKDCNFSNDAEKYIKLIAADVDTLTPSFIRSHQIGILVKDTRSKFKNNQNINHQCKSLTAAMKKVFHEKSESEPVDFKPKLKAKKKSKVIKEQVDNGDTRMKALGEESLVPKSTPVKADPGQIKEKVVVPVSEDSNTEKKVHEEKSKPVKIETKPPRKSFSLANMFERKDVCSNNATDTDQNKEDSMPQQQHILEKPPAPKWLTHYNPTGVSFESEPDRVYAMQFLLDATACLPEGKVDRTSVARALEDALYTKYDGDVENYMQRLHDICAAIAGKKTNGFSRTKDNQRGLSDACRDCKYPEKATVSIIRGILDPIMIRKPKEYKLLSH